MVLVSLASLTAAPRGPEVSSAARSATVGRPIGRISTTRAGPEGRACGLRVLAQGCPVVLDAAYLQESLIDFETAKPEPKGRDISVAVKAISANPVDYKVRKRAAPPEGETKILGYDAAEPW
jgi:hypothetical protein